MPSGNSPGIEFLRNISKFEKKKRNSSQHDTWSIKHEIIGNSRRSRAVMAKKCIEKECCTYKVVVLSILIYSSFSDVLVAVAVALVTSLNSLLEYSNNSKCVERIVVVFSPINRLRLISEERWIAMIAVTSIIAGLRFVEIQKLCYHGNVT